MSFNGYVQMAAQLWSDKLGELFTEDDSQPDRIHSAPHRHRRNSLDAASVTSSMLEEQFHTEERATPMSSNRIRKFRRIHSAEAAISLLRHLLKGMFDDNSVCIYGTLNTVLSILNYYFLSCGAFLAKLPITHYTICGKCTHIL